MVYVQIAAGIVWVNVFAVLAVSAAPAPAGPEHEWTMVTRLLEEARETEQRIAATPSNGERQHIARQALARHAAQIRRVHQTKGPAGPFLLYWKARLHLIAGNNAAFRTLAGELAAERTVAPEVWIGIIEIAPHRDVQRQYQYQLGRLLPTSVFSRFFDNRMSDGRATEQAGQPTVPSPRRTNMRPIAELCERVLPPALARDAWLEAAYIGSGSPSIWRIGKGSWLSCETGDAWLRAAALERDDNGTGPALDYVAKALVFGRQEHYEEAKDLIESWRNQGPVPPVDEPRQIDTGDVLKLAHLYTKQRLHPRAMALLRDFEHVVGEQEANALRRQYMDEWLDLLAYSCSDRDIRCVRLGQPADTVEQRRKITVPRILDEERLAEAAKTLRDIISRW